MRLDAHQHFWKFDGDRYGWIDESMTVLRRDFGPEDLVPHLEDLALDGSVVVQARCDLDETRWLLALAREHDHVMGVVGWVDLCDADCARDLAELSREESFKGVRHVVQDEPDDEFLLRDDFRAGVARLEEFGLTYDLLIHPRHLGPAVRFVDHFPDQPFVLDHLAKPFIARGELEPWARDLRELARRPNVCCKVSGLVTEAEWNRWAPDDFTPYLDVCLEAFGEDRLMFGSDWPVCLLSADYTSTAGIVTAWAHALDEGQRRKLFGENAARFYSIS